MGEDVLLFVVHGDEKKRDSSRPSCLSWTARPAVSGLAKSSASSWMDEPRDYNVIGGQTHETILRTASTNGSYEAVHLSTTRSIPDPHGPPSPQPLTY